MVHTMISVVVLYLGVGVLSLIMAQNNIMPDLEKQPTTIVSVHHTQHLKDDWEYTSFTTEGLDSTRFKLLKDRIQDGTFRKIDGIVVAKSGKILIEEYFNDYNRYKLHEIRSATKSIGSALLGIAFEKEYIASVEDKLYSYFKNGATFQNMDTLKNEITLEHVLNMTTGLDSDDMDDSSAGNESNVLQADNIIRYMLDLSMVNEPGRHWAYSTGSAHLIGAIIEKSSGLSVQDFAQTYLFEPLNITNYKWKTTGGIAHTGGGFWMLPIDMAKIGQLYLNKGTWHGLKIIDEDWINESSKSHLQVTKDMGYGYMWWKWIFYIDERPFSAFSAQGNGENNIFVFPDLDLVVVLTGSSFGEDYGPAQTSMILSKYILPAVIQDIDSHRDEPYIRNIPKALFALCTIVLLSAFILWPIRFIILKVRSWRKRYPNDQREKLLPGIARIVACFNSLIVLCLIALLLAESQLFTLLINSAMSHPLGILEVFLGTKFITVVAVVMWIIMFLVVVQSVLTVLVHKNKVWNMWLRLHFTAMTLTTCYFIIVMLWWGFGKIPS